MGYTSKTLGFQTVTLSEGYTAIIRRLTKAQMDRAQVYLFQGARQRSEVTAGEQARVISEGAMDSSGYTTALLLAGVVEWTLDDEQGAILPITKETIENVLTAVDSTRLIKAISDLVAVPDPQPDSSGLST